MSLLGPPSDLYSIQLSTDGTQSVVQGLTADGQQMWQNTLPNVSNNSVPDGFGGLLLIEHQTCNPGQTDPMTIVDLDAATGEPLWEWPAAGVYQGTQIVYCYPAGTAPLLAVRGDGAVIVAEPTNAAYPPLTVIAPPGGSGVSPSIPPSTLTDAFGNQQAVQCCMGPPMVNSDGAAYVEYEVRNNGPTTILSDTLYLMQVNPDNTYTSVQLSSTTQNQALRPGNIIPDGNGGVLATWTISPSSGPVPQYPYQAVDVSGGVAGTAYGLPFSPQSVTNSQSPTLVLGENGVAFASGHTLANDGSGGYVDQIASFNVGSGSQNWNYQAPSGHTLTIVEATAGGGITISDSTSGIFHLDATGQSSVSNAIRLARRVARPAVTTSLPPDAVPVDLSTWVSIASGIVNALWSPNGTNGIPTLLAQSVYPRRHGDTHDQNSTPYCQRTNIICVLAPTSESLSVNGPAVQRNITYEVFSLQGAYLMQIDSSQTRKSKIVLMEQNSTSSTARICDWETPSGKCYSPDPTSTDNKTPGFLTDHDSCGGGAAYSVDMVFGVDRGQVQVFWPLKVGSHDTWYGAWYQTAHNSINAVTIEQQNPNFSNPLSCPTGCSPIQSNGTQ